MSCIICFFDDDYQAHLRAISQHSADKFENVISEYKHNFLDAFSRLTKMCECETHKSSNKIEEKFFDDMLQYLKKIEISSKFDFFKDVYLLWANGKTKDAIEKLKSCENLLEEEISTFGLFFKGRISEKYMAKEDLYHIPFNKRNLIENQRYSMSGIPSIYLSRSIFGVFAELRHLDKDLSQMNISSFLLNPQCRLKICDFSNEFMTLLEGPKGAFGANAEIDFYDVSLTNWQKSSKTAFLKFIAISLCSFKRQNESKGSFCEEYILPQLVTEVAREKGYDGIQFQSTRISKDLAYIDGKFYSNRHKLNIVLFTKCNEKSIYDEELISKFIIFKPLKIGEANAISKECIKKLRKEIVEIDNKKCVFDTVNKLAEYSSICDSIVLKELKIKESSNSAFVSYEDSCYGKLHYYFLYLNLLKILRFYRIYILCCNRINRRIGGRIVRYIKKLWKIILGNRFGAVEKHNTAQYRLN